MRLLRLDSVGGASGDMLLGALVGLGADLDRLQAILKSLPIEEFQLAASEVKRAGQLGVQVTVSVLDARHPHRGVKEIREIIAQGELGDRTRALALATFERLAEAEGAVHGVAPEDVHLHEVGAMDAIIDIVGACACLDMLRIDGVQCSALPVGSGSVDAAHGVLPLPVPATARLLKDHHVVPTDLPFELVTPTGAALITTWLNALPAVAGQGGAIRSCAMGVGSRDLPDRPNGLRAMLLERDADAVGTACDDACRVLECNVDDMSPELVGALYDRLLKAGALDVFTTPVQMKKQRPGILITVLCRAQKHEALVEIIFAESTTFGIRAYAVSRNTLARERVAVATPYGAVNVKVGRWKGREVTRAPEYEDCLARAGEHGVPVKTVYDAALKHMAPRPEGNDAE